MNDIIYGKKVILFGLKPMDLEHFVKLHREDKKGYLQQYCLKKMTEEEGAKYVTALLYTNQLRCWSVYLKGGKKHERAGFIYLTNLTSFSANISGVMDADLMKGLLKQIRRGGRTFAEDSIRTLIQFCFESADLSRVETTVLAKNRRALALDKKCGFIEEGRLRDSFHMDDKFYDVIQLAILKKEWKNE